MPTTTQARLELPHLGLDRRVLHQARHRRRVRHAAAPLHALRHHLRQLRVPLDRLHGAASRPGPTSGAGPAHDWVPLELLHDVAHARAAHHTWHTAAAHERRQVRHTRAAGGPSAAASIASNLADNARSAPVKTVGEPTASSSTHPHFPRSPPQ